MTLVVKRSALKMWLMAMAGIPLLVISLDVLTNRRITDWLRELIFRPEDTQIYEPRDVIWAWVMALFAGFIVLWGLKELFMPTRVVESRHDGLALKLGGPFRSATVIPWEQLDDVSGKEVEDEGDRVPVLVVKVLSRGDLPEHPWGARWIEDDQLAVLAQDWAEDPRTVADQVIEFAVQTAENEARERADRIVKGLEGEEE
ncbi:MAG: hypothetical protein U9N56_02385 [Actinomycetota bacterium]|nr:hypothetical protein [Actinomycetota bacterium]